MTNSTVKYLSKSRKKSETNNEDAESVALQIQNDFMALSHVACPSDEVLSNIVVDICYMSNKNKSFAWNIVGEQIFKNILKNSGGIITYPVKNDDGDIEFCGKRFVLHTQQIGGESNDDFK